MDHVQERQGALSDSEATLRQVRGVLDDLYSTPLGPAMQSAERDAAGPGPPPALPALLDALDAACASLPGIVQELRSAPSEPGAPALDRLLEIHRSLTALGGSVRVSTFVACSALQGVENSVRALTRRDATPGDGDGEGLDARAAERILGHLGQLQDHLGVARPEPTTQPAGTGHVPAEARPSPAPGV